MQGSTSTHCRGQAAVAALGVGWTSISSCSDTLTCTHAPPTCFSQNGALIRAATAPNRPHCGSQHPHGSHYYLSCLAFCHKLSIPLVPGSPTSLARVWWMQGDALARLQRAAPRGSPAGGSGYRPPRGCSRSQSQAPCPRSHDGCSAHWCPAGKSRPGHLYLPEMQPPSRSAPASWDAPKMQLQTHITMGRGNVPIPPRSREGMGSLTLLQSSPHGPVLTGRAVGTRSGLWWHDPAQVPGDALGKDVSVLLDVLHIWQLQCLWGGDTAPAMVAKVPFPSGLMEPTSALPCCCPLP